MNAQTSLVMGGSRALSPRRENPELTLSLLVPRTEAAGTGASSPPPPPAASRTDAPAAAPAPDSAAPFKRRRRRSSSAAAPKVSMFGLRELWLMPLLAELVLMFGAAWMAFCLLRVTQDPHAGFPLSSVLLLAGTYAGLAFYSRLHELFLPRKVVFIGVGTFLLVSAGFSFALMSDAYLVGGRSQAMRAALVLTPVHLFILRCLLIFREARFTPAAHLLSIRLKCRGEKVDELRRKLRFWLS